MGFWQRLRQSSAVAALSLFVLIATALPAAAAATTVVFDQGAGQQFQISTPPTVACTWRRTVTLADDGQTVYLGVGEQFLLNLDSGYTWTVHVSDPTMLARVCSVDQGVYRGLTPGTTTLEAVGNPRCYPLCLQPSRLFKIQVRVGFFPSAQ